MTEAPKKTAKVLMTPTFRVNFPHVFAKHAFEGSKPVFSVQAVWDPAKFTAEEKALWAEIVSAMQAAVRAKLQKTLAELSPDKKGIRRSEDKPTANLGAGKLFANLKTESRPGILRVEKDKSMSRVGPEYGNEEEIYSGCYARATVSVYAYNHPASKGVALGLHNLLKVMDGERLGPGRREAEADFANTEIEDAWLDAGAESAADPDLAF